MKTFLLTVGLVAVAGSAWALTPIVYRRPDPQAPLVRVDGRLRGAEDLVTTLTVLAPEDVGLTARPQPCLFWYQSRGSKTRFELTLLRAGAAKPVLEAQFDPIAVGGVCRFRLADYKAKLVPNVEYRWTVALVVDPENRSKDIVASGVIKYVPPSQKVTDRLAAKPNDKPFIYADEGYWYDSLEELSDEIEQKPRERDLRKIRGMLFMQAGLKEAADHELDTAGKTPAPDAP